MSTAFAIETESRGKGPRQNTITFTFRHIGGVGASEGAVENSEKVDAVSKPVRGLAHP